MIINEDYVNEILSEAKTADDMQVQKVLDKAREGQGLSHREVALLLQTSDNDKIKQIFEIAGSIKKRIYGNRIVLFAPLYISNYCVNDCVYCGYRRSNKINRRRLTMQEIQKEVTILEKMGHKRLALEMGEDSKNCDIDYVLNAIDAIYKTKNENGNIRRVNVNIAATTVENYERLKEIGIGTYILFQETYNKKDYDKYHPNCIKGDYEYHISAFDRAMEAGIDDVGAGVLFGLSEPKFEVLSLMIHNEYLEKKFGVGFHTISVPRLKKAEGMSLDMFPNLVDDEMFKKIVAIIRIAVPFTGMILSTREAPDLRREVIKYGISQISAGSCTGVGGYKEYDSGKNVDQFNLSDHRKPIEILKELVGDKHLPSYCTACYRKGRTGDRFMSLAKSGQIQYVCQPNAILTFWEYILDYGDDELKEKGMELINSEIEMINREDIKIFLKEGIKKLGNGQRDIYL